MLISRGWFDGASFKSYVNNPSAIEVQFVYIADDTTTVHNLSEEKMHSLEEQSLVVQQSVISTALDLTYSYSTVM